MEQAGIIGKLSRQYLSFKPKEPEILEPLKLEHFNNVISQPGGGGQEKQLI